MKSKFVLIAIAVSLVTGAIYLTTDFFKVKEQELFNPQSLCGNDTMFVSTCVYNNSNIIYSTSIGAPDVPMNYYDSNGKFIASCGGMPLPPSVSRDLFEDECNFTNYLNCPQYSLKCGEDK